MGNRADEIERWILRKLANEQEEMVILQRNEMAEELECAPSQISYVLSTRFSVSRGFVVESRRGLGGFIRIARTPIKKVIFTDIAEQIDPSVTVEELEDMLSELGKNGFLRAREIMILMEAFVVLFHYLPSQKRAEAIRDLLLRLGNIEY